MKISVKSLLNIICLFSTAYAEIIHTQIMVYPSNIFFKQGRSYLRLRGLIYQYEDKPTGNPVKACGISLSPKNSETTMINLLSAVSPYNCGEDDFRERLQALRLYSSSYENKEVDLNVKIVDPGVCSAEERCEFGKMKIFAKDSADKGQKVTVRVNDRGYFEADVKLSVDPSKAMNIHGSVNPTIWTRISIKGDDQNGGSNYGTYVKMNILRVSENKQDIQLISDVDDTVKVSGIQNGVKEILSNAVLREYKPVEGMVDFFNKLSADMKQRKSAGKPSGKVSYHFVSASPWEFAIAYINQFIMKNRFPWPSFTSDAKFKLDEQGAPIGLVSRFAAAVSGVVSPTANTDLMKEEGLDHYFDQIRQTKSYRFKMFVFKKWFSDPMWNRMILLGDSTEADFVTYHDQAKKHGFLNEVDGTDRNQQFIEFKRRMKHLFKDLNNWEQHVNVFMDVKELMKIDFVGGKCHQ